MSENQIDREKVYAYFNKYHGNLQPSTNGWYSCDCPICGSKGKFALNFNYLVGKCWKSCFNGFLLDVVGIYHGISYFESRELIDSMEPSAFRLPAAINRAARNSKIQLPRGYHSILDGTGSLAQRARYYLEDRGFDLNKMDRLGIGYVDTQDANPLQDYFGRIIVPLKRDGSLMYFLGRTFIDDYQRYKNPSKELCGVGKSELFFGEENLYLKKDVFLVEGWPCACTMDGVSMQGSVLSTIQRNIIIKSSVESVYITTDAGYYQNGLTMARALLPHKKVKVLNLDWFQDNKIGKDPNEIGKENVMNVMEDTPWMDVKLLYTEIKRTSNVLL
jgi:hypothetical protein